jgi:hypothetical protein
MPRKPPSTMKQILNRRTFLVPWWFSWPLKRCVVCQRRFRRSWPWCCFEECCSRSCNDYLIDRVDKDLAARAIIYNRQELNG